MNLLCVNQDTGISESRRKGAAIHLRAMRKAFNELGHRVFVWEGVAADTNGTGNPVSDLSALCVTHNIDLIYERYALGKDAAAVTAKERAIPLIVEVNAPLAEEAAQHRGYVPNERDVQADRRLFSSARMVVAVSAETASYAGGRGAREEGVMVCANGVDLSLFYPRNRALCKQGIGIDSKLFVVGFHGRLRPWHGFEKLVHAVLQLHLQDLPIHLLSVGEGPYESLLQEALPKSAYTHIPWLDQQALGAVVAAYDALPLMYDRSAPCYFSPLKLYEAMATGAIPVVPNVGDLGKAISHNDNGVLYDDEPLANVLSSLILERANLEAMREGAIVEAQKHSWTQIAQSILTRAGYGVVA